MIFDIDIAMNEKSEWLEIDGLGGFALGTVSGLRTRRYHALLAVATSPPCGRFVLVNGIEAWIQTASGVFPISSQKYSPNVIHPDGMQRIKSFSSEPWPRWVFASEDGTQISQEILVEKGVAGAVLFWKLLTPARNASLFVRPLLSGRDYHSLHRENPVFCFDPEIRNGNILWHPYSGVPGVIAVSNAEYTHSPEWYRNFLYSEEQERGLDYIEDLASPGVFRWDLCKDDALLFFRPETAAVMDSRFVHERFSELREKESKRRKQFPSRLHRSADDYIVSRGTGKTILAGYPRFGDWGRDTFIALRGLCLAAGRLAEAEEILLEWAGSVSQGMLPNRFPDHGDQPEFNSVDASLWYVVAVNDFFTEVKKKDYPFDPRNARILQETVQKILAGYARGTRFGIRLEDDGLLSAGEPGTQLTWMDAKIGDWVVTPRIGKPVEVEALWLNALAFGSSFSKRWEEVFERGLKTFRERFWNSSRGCLYDVIDVEGVGARVDPSLRPNQIFAVGGLPLSLLEKDQARAVVEIVEKHLWTPRGLRSLAPMEPGYIGRYQGGVRERDGAYHQGTVWIWLIGAFVEAWVRTHGEVPEIKAEAHERFIKPLLALMNEAGIGHLPEIADGDPPHQPQGCPFQAWSVGEALRLLKILEVGYSSLRATEGSAAI